MRRMQASIAYKVVENGKGVKGQKQENVIEGVEGVQEAEAVRDINGCR